MADRVCPFWVGYLLINPVRRLFENPYQLLGDFVREGMVVLEPGAGMGYFTIPLARMVGSSGKVIATDIQPQMMAVLEKRVSKAGMTDRIERRLCRPDRLDLPDLRERVDLVAAIHMLHETTDPANFLKEIHRALKRDGRLLIIEPRWHVSEHAFKNSIALGQAHGFAPDRRQFDLKGRRVSLRKM